MKILVINTGSSSLKYQMLDMTNESVLAKGVCDRIGLEHAFVKHTKTGSESVVIEVDIYNHKVAMKEVIKVLLDKKIGVISDTSEIAAVGHRVVHGGENFYDSVIITDEVMRAIRDCVELAPLHNPPNIVGIEACKDLMPNTPMVAVFDTAFHQTMPDFAYIYALPYELYEKYKLRKYGFHGTSHKYVSQVAAEKVTDILNKKSGVLGISGISGDFRDLWAEAKDNKRAQLALDVFHYEVKKFICAYAGDSGGVDCIIFTAGVCENSAKSRESCCTGLEFLGVKIDSEKNNVVGRAKEISTSDSTVKVFVIPTNEELMIARDTKEVVNS